MSDPERELAGTVLDEFRPGTYLVRLVAAEDCEMLCQLDQRLRRRVHAPLRSGDRVIVEASAGDATHGLIRRVARGHGGA